MKQFRYKKDTGGIMWQDKDGQVHYMYTHILTQEQRDKIERRVGDMLAYAKGLIDGAQTAKKKV